MTDSRVPYFFAAVGSTVCESFSSADLSAEENGDLLFMKNSVAPRSVNTMRAYPRVPEEYVDILGKRYRVGEWRLAPHLSCERR